MRSHAGAWERENTTDAESREREIRYFKRKKVQLTPNVNVFYVYHLPPHGPPWEPLLHSPLFSYAAKNQRDFAVGLGQ